MMTSVAVVILNYNGEKLLPQFLPSVIEHSHQARVIVVDNGSTDQSINLILQSFPQVELIQFDANYGFCGGYNKAISQIEADIVVLLNSDVEVTPGWLTSPTQLIQSNSSIAAVQPKILSYLNKNQFEYAGAAGGFIDHYGYPFCRGRIFQSIENDNGQYNDQQQIFWASGACMFIKRNTFLELGGFDEDFFAHMEEIDLCWRLNRSGYQVFYDGTSTVYHLGGGTLASNNPRKVYLNFRNGLSLLVKNYRPIDLFIKLPVRVMLDFVAAVAFLIHGFPSSSLAVLKAHLISIIRIPKNIDKRLEYPKIGFSIKDNLILNKSIVYQHFGLSKKTYGSIRNPK